MKRRLWLIGKGHLGPVLLGQGIRTTEMASYFASRGWDVIIAMDSCDRELPLGVAFKPLKLDLFAQFQPRDVLLTTTFLPPLFLLRLVFSGIPFHADFYTTGAMENLETIRHRSWLSGLSIRRRTAAKYRLLLSRAERVYFSTRQQLVFIAGMLYGCAAKRWPDIATSLPSRSRLVPMGVSDEPWTTGRPTPYPESLRGRPIFLWGGGIWSWYDMDTLFAAFRRLLDQGHPACLYFLAGSNTSGLKALDTPVRMAREKADNLGLTGKNVFFHDVPVTYDQVPAYLEHSTAGILSNPAAVESLGSWRTRLLQTLWSQKPLVTSGFDPLSELMADAGAARVVAAGDAKAFSEALIEIADNSDLQTAMSRASAKVGEHLRWSRLLAGLEEDITSNAAFSDSRNRPSILDALRYLTGF